MTDSSTMSPGPADVSLMLEAKGIGRQADGRWLLDEVSLSVHQRDRIALVGQSGSGKTLLLRSLALLDPIQAGVIRWQGEEVHGNAIPQFRSRVIYLPQRPALAEGPVEDYLRLPYSLAVHRDRQFDRQRIMGWLESLGRSESFLSLQQQDLSGGEAQLAALLRAIQLDPDLLLLDEPTAALDAAAVATVESLIGHWLGSPAERRAAIWVTHDREQAQRVATSIWHMRSGRLTGED